MTKSEQKEHHFNYFSVDFDEELSAFSGQYLVQQTLYMEHAIQRIFECYTKASHKPTSLIAIGHSMGGIVLRGLINSPTFDYRKINTIITLATPHRQPTMNIDPVLNNYYKNLTQAWSSPNFARDRFENITFLSLGGGFRDFLVRSDLCLKGASENNNQFSWITSSLPNIWLSNDHQCIIWCNELVRALTRMFFKMVNPETNQIYRSPKIRAKILHKVFLLHPEMSKKPNLTLCTQLKTIQSMIIQNTDTQCYKLDNINARDIVNIWIHKSVKLLTCGNSMKTKSCKQVMFTKHNPGGYKFISLKGKTNATQYYLTDMNNKAEIFISKSNNRNVNKLELQPPLSLSSKTEKLSFPSPRFYTEISLLGLTSTWKCYNLHVISDSKCINGSVDPCIVVEIENESTGELYVSQPESQKFQNIVDMKLKFFTLPPSNESLILRIWSKLTFSNLQIDIHADVKCALGQIIRFNPDALIRYTLILNLVNRELNGFVSGFTFLFITFRTTLNCFVFDATNNSLSLFDTIVVESCVIGMSLSIALFFEFLIGVILYIVQKMLFLQHIRRKFFSINSVVVKYMFGAIFIVYFGYIYRAVGPHAVLISCLIVHLFHDISHESIGGSRCGGGSLTFLPITLFSGLVPIVLTIKTILNNSGVTNSSFINMNVMHLTWCYVLYLMVNLVTGHGLGSGIDEMLGFGLISTGVKRALLGVVCLVFMLTEVFNLYNLSYLIIACMVIRIL